ncbi:DUF3124 [Desulfonema limicola]|uniref:DUF3124 n=1 Tax=Desulfonema limicola TaxID=45656 RepID=A0A975GHM6_9BACT|nr:DUF3124 domain-containing protein [Desulfonema limicola]QTA81656.1 DUF3124 [Desulfonema limicola]
MKKLFYYLMIVFILNLANPFIPAQAEEPVCLSKGQTVYVPVYSHIYAGSRELPILLTVTLSIRNTDAQKTITIISADYYGTNGELIKKYSDKAFILKPFESTRYIIPQKDKAGGSGASFLVRWKSDESVNPPLIESIMIGAEGQQGISFTSRGQVISGLN